MTRYPELTGLRCAAVMMVVLDHAANTLPGGFTGWFAPLHFLANGGLGVQIFFVLSGFLITGLLKAEYRETNRIDLFRFYLRRTLRIWPAFYAFLVVLVLLADLELVDIHWRQFGFAALHAWNYSEMLGLGPTNAAHGEGAWYLGHFWSLSLEEQFYWFWPPLLIFIFIRRSEGLLPALILMIPLVRVASYFLAPGLRTHLGAMLHTAVDSILVGCYVALKRERIVAMLDSTRYAAAIVTTACVALVLLFPALSAHFLGYWTLTYGPILSAAAVGLLIVGLTHMKSFWLSRLLRVKVALFIGTISYSLYLWQQLFLYPASPVSFGFPLNVVQAIVVASLSYWLIETPFLKLKDGFAKRGLGMSRRQQVDTRL